MLQNTAPNSGAAGTWLERLCRDLGIPASEGEDALTEALAGQIQEKGLSARDVIDIALVVASAARTLRAGFLRNVVTLDGHENLTPRMQVMLIQLQGASRQVGLPNPVERIISGYRSPERQAELREAWDRGDREGLRARPAESSAHSRGEAVDLSGTEDELKAWGIAWEALGGRWGGRFFPDRDTPHFDLGA